MYKSWSILVVKGLKFKLKMSKLVCLEDFEEEAHSRLDRNAWGYYSSGAIGQQTLRDNINAFSR